MPKISVLPNGSALAGTETTPLVQAGATVKLTWNDYAAFVVGYNVQLSAIAGLTSAADRVPYFTGSGTAALATFTTAGRALVDDADASAQLTTLGVSTFVKTILDDADAAAVRATIGAAASAGSGTVTSVATGAGLTGGPITTTGTVALAAIADQRVLANVSGGSLAPSATAFSALTGVGSALAWTTGRTLSITGDLAYTSPSFDGSGNVTAAGTLATVNSNVGTFGDATHVGSFTVNAKGLITAASSVAITAPFGWAYQAADASTLTVSTIISRFEVGFAWTLTQNLPQSDGHVATAPSGGSVVIDIQVSGSSVGSVNFASGSNDPTFTMASAAAVAANAPVTLVLPANLRGMSGLLNISIIGTR